MLGQNWRPASVIRKKAAYAQMKTSKYAQISHLLDTEEKFLIQIFRDVFEIISTTLETSQ